MAGRTINDIASFKEALKSKGYKATPQRIAVHEAMMELGHASADMVQARIAENGSTRITISSVYNILSQLALMGIYRHRMSANNKMYFDVNNSRHVHLYDSRNHEYKDIADEEILDLVEQHFRRKHYRGYKVDAIDIQLVCHPTRKTTQK